MVARDDDVGIIIAVLSYIIDCRWVTGNVVLVRTYANIPRHSRQIMGSWALSEFKEPDRGSEHFLVET